MANRKETVRAGIGATGLRKSPEMKKDVMAALRAKGRKKSLEINVARNIRRIRAGMKAQTVSEAYRSFREEVKRVIKERKRGK